MKQVMSETSALMHVLNNSKAEGIAEEWQGKFSTQEGKAQLLTQSISLF